MAKRQQITKTKKLRPEDLQIQEMYFLVSQPIYLFKTRENAINWPVDDRSCGLLDWHEGFIVVSLESLPKEKPCGLKTYVFKVIAGEKMGWILVRDGKSWFKKLELDAIEEDNSQPPALRYLSKTRLPISWTLPKFHGPSK